MLNHWSSASPHPSDPPSQDITTRMADGIMHIEQATTGEPKDVSASQNAELMTAKGTE